MAFYAVMRHDTRDDTIHVFKCPTASDPNTITNWTSQATYVLDGRIKSIWTFVHSSDIYIAVSGYRKGNQDNFGYVKFIRYDVGTDAIDIDEEQVDDNDAIPKETAGSARTEHAVTMAVRSDDDVIVLFNVPVSVTSPNANTSYSRREGGTWTRGIVVETGDRSIAGVAVLGDSDRVHFFLKKDILGDIVHRSLSGTNSLDTTQTVDADIRPLPDFFVGGVFFDDGTKRVRVAYEDVGLKIFTAFGNSTANPTFTIEAAASDNNPLSTNLSTVGDLVLDGQKSHLIYSEDGAKDIFIDENDGIGGWGVDTEEQDAVTCNALSANTYNRSGPKLAYLWDDAGTTRYDEVDITGENPVSRLDICSFEALGLADRQDVSPFEAAGTVIVAIVSPFESLQNVDVQSVAIFESLQAASRVVIASFEALGLADQQDLSPFEAKGFTSRSDVSPFESKGFVSRLDTAPFESEGFVSRLDVAPFEAISTVAVLIVAPFESRAAAVVIALDRIRLTSAIGRTVRRQSKIDKSLRLKSRTITP